MKNKILHWIVAILAFGIPMLMSAHPGFLDLTIGGVINAFYLWLSNYLNPTHPIS